jgi:pimeloyl-ACP methyl ester carboxylesterase
MRIGVHLHANRHEAQLNPKANVVYLSRPCQYTTRAQNPQCNARYWGKARYAPEVMHSYADIINQLKAQYHPTELHLVGYSGGAAIAMWLATQRTDIRSVTTVAGNVDPKAFSRLHGVDDLTESEDVSAALTTMPAIVHHHYVGALDNTVPLGIAQSMMNLLPESTKKCGQITLVEGVSHTSGWEAYWKQHLSQQPGRL